MSPGEPERAIVVINPNSTQAVTDGMDHALANLRRPGGPAVRCVTLAEGPPGIETDAHIIITWADREEAATQVVKEAYPNDEVVRLTKRPRDTWVISKAALGISHETADLCTVARDCLSKAAGDKVHAIRLYMNETGVDLNAARKVIESNMVMGW